MSLYKWVVHGFTAANAKMARFVHKHTPSSSATKKLVFFISCAGLLGAALIADFIWASSSSACLSIASNWALEKTGIVVVSNQKAKKAARVSPLKTGIFFLHLFLPVLVTLDFWDMNVRF